MKAEEVYNIAVHLSEKELEKLCTLLNKRVCNIKKSYCKPPKKKLITDEEARSYLLKTVLGSSFDILSLGHSYRKKLIYSVLHI